MILLFRIINKYLKQFSKNTWLKNPISLQSVTIFTWLLYVFNSYLILDINLIFRNQS